MFGSRKEERELFKKTLESVEQSQKNTEMIVSAVCQMVEEKKSEKLEETDALLKISPTKFWGPDPNTEGNFCVVGHNYRNSKFFSKVPTLENGDIIEITDSNNKTLRYSVYSKYEVDPNDISCIDQNTNGKKEVTLITCTNDSKLRVIVKARAL